MNDMAEEQKKSYPMLPIGHWWQLRKKFKQSIPGVVTDSYLATVLQMQPNSARANVLPFLRQLGIINEDGKPTERAKLWRDDGHYPEVCKAMLSEVYPRELPEAVPDPNADRSAADRWFANQTGVGAAAVRRMVALYTVLAEADATKQPEQEKRDRVVPKTKPERSNRAAKAVLGAEAVVPEAPNPARPLPTNQALAGQPPTPGIYINLQVHISADATSDQIDQIFASMAKHIYLRG
jgi:Family of unknown function (DUF5343)